MTLWVRTRDDGTALIAEVKGDKFYMDECVFVRSVPLDGGECIVSKARQDYRVDSTVSSLSLCLGGL